MMAASSVTANETENDSDVDGAAALTAAVAVVEAEEVQHHRHSVEREWMRAKELVETPAKRKHLQRQRPTDHRGGDPKTTDRGT